VGDPGRAYMPTSKVRPLATYHVATSRDLEDAEVKRTVVWRLV
jgi:predicted nicotinamide N-methyase